MLKCKSLIKLYDKYHGEIQNNCTMLVPLYEHTYDNTVLEEEKLKLVMGVDLMTSEVSFWMLSDDIEPFSGDVDNSIYGFEEEIPNMDLVFEMIADGVLEYVPLRKKEIA
jgi:hypothetical protein